MTNPSGRFLPEHLAPDYFTAYLRYRLGIINTNPSRTQFGRYGDVHAPSGALIPWHNSMGWGIVAVLDEPLARQIRDRVQTMLELAAQSDRD
jgi:hypothetical protein